MKTTVAPKGHRQDLMRRPFNENGRPLTDMRAELGQRQAARTYVRSLGTPIVIKADGVAAGKGVIIGQNMAAANSAVDMMLSGRLGAAGSDIVIEERCSLPRLVPAARRH